MADIPANHPEIKKEDWKDYVAYNDPTTKDQPVMVPIGDPVEQAESNVVSKESAEAAEAAAKAAAEAVVETDDDAVESVVVKRAKGTPRANKG